MHEAADLPSPNAADLYDLLHRLCHAAAVLPPAQLLPGQRMALSGHVFAEVPDLVRCVAEALAWAPDLFRPLNPPLPAQALSALLDEAQALTALHHLLAKLAQRAGDLALIRQAQASQAAQETLRRVRAAPEDTEEARTLCLLLHPAEAILRKRHERRSAGTKRPAPAAPSPRHAPSAQARAARTAAAEEARAEVDALIGTLCARRRCTARAAPACSDRSDEKESPFRNDLGACAAPCTMPVDRRAPGRPSSA